MSPSWPRHAWCIAPWRPQKHWPPRASTAEVIDPRTLNPLDEETILNSVRKTQRLVIAYEAYERGGVGAEIAALVANKALDYLDAPIERVASFNTPMPFSPKLENYVVPTEERIMARRLKRRAGR